MEIGNIVDIALVALVVFSLIKVVQLKDRVEALEHLVVKLIDDSNDRKTI